jgi:uncharacterized protein YndB with AHSA1/START domain
VSSPDRVSVSTLVAVEPAAAFEAFTADIDRWWKRTPRHRFAPGQQGILCFETGPGGRLVESWGPGPEEAFEVGRVLAWEPGRRLAFEFRFPSFGPGEVTEVEVRFEREGDGTRVSLEHRGWDRLRPDHPARGGLEGGAFVSLIGLYWGDLLTGVRARAERRLSS